MLRAGAMPAQGFEVLRCTVALVLGKLILRVALIEFSQVSVALHLGQDGGGGDRNRAGVAMNHGTMRNGKRLGARRGKRHGIGKDKPGEGTSAERARIMAWREA